MKLKQLHAAAASLVVAFAALHLINHLVALAGVGAHQAFLEGARRIYRAPAIEVVLLAAVGVQLGSGLLLAWRARGGRRRLQVASGLVLAGFLPIHVGAVLAARSWAGLDTNFHFAAAGLHVPGWAWWFGPYYALAVVALFAHLGAALQRRLPPGGGRPRGRRRVVVAAGLAGAACAALILAAMAGLVQEVQIPHAYLASFAAWP